MYPLRSCSSNVLHVKRVSIDTILEQAWSKIKHTEARSGSKQFLLFLIVYVDEEVDFACEGTSWRPQGTWAALEDVTGMLQGCYRDVKWEI
jgi:hypothetical protein